MTCSSCVRLLRSMLNLRMLLIAKSILKSVCKSLFVPKSSRLRCFVGTLKSCMAKLLSPTCICQVLQNLYKRLLHTVLSAAMLTSKVTDSILHECAGG